MTQQSPKPKAIRLTPPQIELLTDIATKPQMYIRIWSRWGKTAHVLCREGLATSSHVDQNHNELRITEKGRAEAARRGITSTEGGAR